MLKERKTVLKRVISFFLCLTVLAGCLVCFSSCKSNEDVYKLGSYTIKEDEYNYLLGVYRRDIGKSLGYDNTDWNNTNSSGMTIGQYVDSVYASQFQSHVLMLLYSQAIFDDEGLSLTKDEERIIETNVLSVIAHFGNYNEKKFDEVAEPYGFSADTLRSVYTMQVKQQKVMIHLFGEKGEKILPETVEQYYKDEYLKFQTLIINHTYKIVENSDGKSEMVQLNELEKQERLDLINDLTNLFMDKKSDYTYKVLTAEEQKMTYEQLWERYSDDMAYPGGCYMQRPTLNQMTASNTLAAAATLKTNEIGKVVANRYFQKSVESSSGGTSINAGDYIEYGYVFVKKLELDDKAYDREENKDFFGANFQSSIINSLFAKQVANYVETEAFYELYQNTALVNSLTISRATPNYLDYELMNSSSSEKK